MVFISVVWQTYFKKVRERERERKGRRHRKNREQRGGRLNAKVIGGWMGGAKEDKTHTFKLSDHLLILVVLLMNTHIHIEAYDINN